MRRMNEVLNEMDRLIDQNLLEDFIARGWVRPVRDETDYIFDEIDISRIYLICELHLDMKFEGDAVDVMLSLMDQLYESRSQLDRISKVIQDQPDVVREKILVRLKKSE